MKNMFFTVINHENILMFSCQFLNIMFAIYINFRIEKLNTATFIGYYIFQRRFLYVVSQPVFENYQHSHSRFSHDIRVVCKYDMPVDIFQWMSLNITLVLKCKMHGKATPKLYEFCWKSILCLSDFLHNPHKYIINLIRCCII